MPVDLSASIYAEYRRSRKRAEEAERRGSAAEASAAYRQAADLMRNYADYTLDGTVRGQRLKRAEALEQLARKLDDQPESVLRSASSRVLQSDAPVDEDDYEAEVLGLIHSTKVQWKDIGGLDNTKTAIKSAYGLALARKPKGVTIDSWRNVLLFGPPGTGKTLLAAATAGNLEATFFNVKVSNILSKYFGESTKLISALYTVARRLNPSVIFLDEFESLTPPRGSGESGAERRIVSTFLTELDGLGGIEDESIVLTMGSTNLPWMVDTAILSRFEKRIYVPLPDQDARLAILKIFITRRGHQTEVPLKDLVQRTSGFSGREIEQVCQTAVTNMTQRANPDLLKVVDKGQEALRKYEIRVRPLTMQDFEVAFEQIIPITTAEMIHQYEDWLKQVEVRS